jgi:hypothetical protein
MIPLVRRLPIVVEWRRVEGVSVAAVYRVGELTVLPSGTVAARSKCCGAADRHCEEPVRGQRVGGPPTSCSLPVWGADWRPEEDGRREAALEDSAALVRFAEGAAAGWSRLQVEAGDELACRDPVVASPRGDVLFSTLLSFQRWHAAFHYRQLVEFLRLDEALDLAGFEDLGLPRDVF